MIISIVALNEREKEIIYFLLSRELDNVPEEFDEIDILRDKFAPPKDNIKTP